MMSTLANMHSRHYVVKILYARETMRSVKPKDALLREIYARLKNRKNTVIRVFDFD